MHSNEQTLFSPFSPTVSTGAEISASRGQTADKVSVCRWAGLGEHRKSIYFPEKSVDFQERSLYTRSCRVIRRQSRHVTENLFLVEDVMREYVFVKRGGGGAE